ncbi:zinc-dependent metalloprotease, partial [Streptomyces albidoflavus]
MARPVRLGPPRDGVRRLLDHHPPRRLRPPPDPADAGTLHRPREQLWASLADARGADGRDALWEHPDMLPTAHDLD